MTGPVNKLGTDWLRIKGWLQEQITTGHNSMERPLLPEEYHAERGRIALARDLIRWVEPDKMEETNEDDYGISVSEDGKY